MSNKNYLNKDKNPLYVLHFPGTGFYGFEDILKDNLTRKFTVHEDISIISIMDSTCYASSPIRTQCENNNITLFNSAINEENWDNTLKIKYILESLEQVTTKYCLIIDGRDAVISHDLDEEFIEKYKSLNIPIVYNGTPTIYPQVPLEPIQEIVKISGKQKFINAGVCIGDVDSLKEFYLKAQEVNDAYPNNSSEQIIIRRTRRLLPNLCSQDSNNLIFRIIHEYDTVAKEINDTDIVLL
jgi:hypothetical protein